MLNAQANIGDTAVNAAARGKELTPREIERLTNQWGNVARLEAKAAKAAKAANRFGKQQFKRQLNVA